MHKIDIEKTLVNLRAALTEFSKRADADDRVIYSPEAIEATVALSRWVMSLNGKQVSNDQIFMAASGIISIPLANMLTSIQGESLTDALHLLVERFHSDLHRLTDDDGDDPNISEVEIATRDVGDA